MKFKKDNIIVEIDNPNVFNVFERLGYVKVEETKEKPKKDEK